MSLAILYIVPHRECGKFLDNTAGDEDVKEVWVEDEDTCVDLEKTQCTVQEREAEADSEQVGEDTKEDDAAVEGQVTEGTTTTSSRSPRKPVPSGRASKGARFSWPSSAR